LPDIIKVSTGVRKLDEALGGGVPKGSWVAITGEPGTGKSILCMHYAWAGLQEGDPVIYVTTEAEFRDVLRQAQQFGMYFNDYEIHYLGGRPSFRKPQLVVIDIFSLLKTARQLNAEMAEIESGRKYAALEIDVLVAAINEAYRVLGVLEEGRKSPYRHVRLIIDSMSAFWADKPAMARRYSYDLKISTHRENVTAYLVSQYAMTTKSLDYEEPIAILKEGDVKVLKIGELVDKYFSEDSDGVRLLNEPVYTLSMDPHTLKVQWKRVKAVIRHRETRKLLRIKLENGQSITITPDHSLYALRRYGVAPVKGSEIRTGDLIPTITAIPSPRGRRPEKHDLAKEFRDKKNMNIYRKNLPDSINANADLRATVSATYRITHDLGGYIQNRVVYGSISSSKGGTLSQLNMSLNAELELLRNFTYSDIGFLEVRDIDVVDPSSEYVYDLSVEDNENFFAGFGWVLAHNSSFGFGLEHIADGVIHLWMDDVEIAKEVRRYLIIKKMRMTEHYEGAFRLLILSGKGIELREI